MQKKFKAAVLGATGAVGQAFMWMLSEHPWIDLTYPVASDSHVGMKYKEAVHWLLPIECPENVSNMEIKKYSIDDMKKGGVQIVFSALPANIANDIEPQLRKEGFWVFSNAASMRYESDVPILIPETNYEQMSLVDKQGYPKKGFVVTNANCSTTGLAMAIAPLRKFNIKSINVCTYQSTSGAGYPGLPFFDINTNCIPYIGGEEEKVVKEIQKILDIKCDVYAYCVRVPVMFGHLEAVWLDFEKKVTTADIIKAWSEFKPHIQTPSSPVQPVLYLSENTFPQSKMAFFGKPQGMQVYTGRLKEQNGKIGFVCLVNNIIKGSAGGSIQNAEYFLKMKGLV